MEPFGTQEWTRGKLSPHKHRIWKALDAAIKRLNRLSTEDRLAFNGRCHADVLNAFALDELRNTFDRVGNSQFLERNNTTYHTLNGCVLWYKQLGDDSLPSNIPTPTAEEMMQGHFSFMPDQLLIVVGFKLDGLKQTLQAVEILRFGPAKRLEFVIEIAEVPVVTHVVTLPARSPAAARRQRTKIEIRNGFEQKSFSSTSE